jgi:hypothetical protein
MLWSSLRCVRSGVFDGRQENVNGIELLSHDIVQLRLIAFGSAHDAAPGH